MLYYYCVYLLYTRPNDIYYGAWFSQSHWRRMLYNFHLHSMDPQCLTNFHPQVHHQEKTRQSEPEQPMSHGTTRCQGRPIMTHPAIPLDSSQLIKTATKNMFIQKSSEESFHFTTCFCLQKCSNHDPQQRVSRRCEDVSKVSQISDPRKTVT